MKCPLDTDIDLVIADRSGVEIDYCPKCRGVWLDRGELDKLIERSAAAVSPAPAPAAAPPTSWGNRGHAPSHGHGHGYPPKKKKSILGEIFDF